jgi:hypothetical protein
MAPVIPAATAAPASTATASTADPQQDLKTAIPDLLRIVKGGDFKTLVQTYAAPAKRAALLSMFDPSSDPDFQKMPPEAQAMILQTMQGPEMKAQLNEMMQTLIAGLESIQDATPTYNDAGDKATYKVTLPPGSTPAGATPPDSGPGGKDSDDLTFVKVDGRWFMDM